MRNGADIRATHRSATAILTIKKLQGVFRLRCLEIVAIRRVLPVTPTKITKEYRITARVIYVFSKELLGSSGLLEELVGRDMFMFSVLFSRSCLGSCLSRVQCTKAHCPMKI